MTTPPGERRGEQASILSSSLVMAAGTVVSRTSGFVRSALLAAALGVGLHADQFAIGNTIPNMLYILLAGGVFNAVLVPQLVRAIREDPDGGQAYTDRIVTVATLFLFTVTVVLVLAAPAVMSLYLGGDWDDPANAAQRASAIDFARWCLPQVFFYGMFVLLGQVLNARGRFGPMMWAPIANNVISVGVLVVYLLLHGPVPDRDASGPFTPGQEALLGLGSTAGIAAQLLVLLPVLRAAGVRFRPRFDLRGTGLGQTFRLGAWTMLFVIVNQAAYTVVVRLAGSGTAGGSADGTGYFVYSTAFIVTMLPHSIITVSLGTAILPRLTASARSGRPDELGATIASTLRTAVSLIGPFVALLPLVAYPVAKVAVGYGAGADTFERLVPTLALFGPGLLFFTVHYLALRGFYAMEQNRLVFFIQCAVATTNVVAAVVLVTTTSAAATAPALALAYGCSYLVGSVVSLLVLDRRARLGLASLAGYAARLVVAVAVSTGCAALVWWQLPLDRDSSRLAAVLVALAITLVDVAVFLVLAQWLRLTEVNELTSLLLRRLPGTGRPGAHVAEPLVAEAGTPSAQVPTMDTDPQPSDEPDRGSEQVATRPGVVLADRYALVDLLSEGTAGQFWRAHDGDLGRDVAVHLISADDDRARALLDAARQAATLSDRHFLRILDASLEPAAEGRPGLCLVVNEWATGRSLDVLLQSEGPLAPRRAAWIVSEVASGLAAAHDAGIVHGRLRPENVLVDATGQVRIIGCAVEAVLHDPVDRDRAADVRELHALLHAALTGSWVGAADSSVRRPRGGPAALEPGSVLRPRQVRAGIPRALDALCDQGLNGAAATARTEVDTTTARGLAEALRDFVGDPWEVAAAEADRGSSVEVEPVRLDPEVPTGVAPAALAPDGRRGDTAERVLDLPDDDAPRPGGRTSAPLLAVAEPPVAAVDQPTEPGMPIFDDASDDVSWLTARADRPAPPPPFEQPPERPLFAPEPEDGGPVRRPRAGFAEPGDGRDDLLPWADDDLPRAPHDPRAPRRRRAHVPGRRWTILAVLVGVVALVLLVVAVVTGTGGLGGLGGDDSSEPGGSPSATAPSSSAPPRALPGVTAAVFDPEGDPGGESDDTGAALDRDPATVWTTAGYDQQLGPGGLKTGVGLVLDLGTARDVARVDLRLAGAPSTVQVFVTDEVPTSSPAEAGLDPAAEATVEGELARLTPASPVTGRYVLVWFTALPQVDGSFRGGIAEAVVRG